MTLHEAAKEGDLDVVIYLTEKDPAGVNNTDNYGLTPLFLAAMEGKYEVLKYFVDERQAYASIKVKGGLTPLLIGAERGKFRGELSVWDDFKLTNCFNEFERLLCNPVPTISHLVHNCLQGF